MTAALLRIFKLKVHNTIAKVYPNEEKQALMTEAQRSKSPNIYPALMLAQNTGMRSSEIRRLQWTHVDLKKRFLIVGKKSKNLDRPGDHAQNCLEICQEKSKR
jgi:integrase